MTTTTSVEEVIPSDLDYATFGRLSDIIVGLPYPQLVMQIAALIAVLCEQFDLPTDSVVMDLPELVSWYRKNLDMKIIEGGVQ